MVKQLSASTFALFYWLIWFYLLIVTILAILNITCWDFFEFWHPKCMTFSNTRYHYQAPSTRSFGDYDAPCSSRFFRRIWKVEIYKIPELFKPAWTNQVPNCNQTTSWEMNGYERFHSELVPFKLATTISQHMTDNELNFCQSAISYVQRASIDKSKPFYQMS